MSDTSPVRALAHLDLLPALGELFQIVLIPPAVASELRRATQRQSAIDLDRHTFMRIEPPPREQDYLSSARSAYSSG